MEITNKEIIDKLDLIYQSSKGSRIALRKEIKQLQALIIVITAGLLVYTNSKVEERESFIDTYGKDIMALALTGSAGYKLMNSNKEAEDEEVDKVNET